MWRFLPGCEPPPPKKVKSNEDVSESAKNYEKNKRQRVFQNSWKQGRTWLVCEDNAMFCSVCKEVLSFCVLFFKLTLKAMGRLLKFFILI